MSSDISGYLVRLRAHLRLDGSVEDDLVRELEAHVTDRTSALVAEGMPPAQARDTAIAALGRPRTLAHLVHQAHYVTPWTEALAGGSAFLLMAVMIGPGLWREPVAASAASALIIGLALYGLWLGRPAWFYPWAGAALSIPIVLGYTAFELLHRELPRAMDGTTTASGLAGLAGAGLYFPIGLIVVAAAVIVAVRRDWLDASVLLSPVPALFAWILSIHGAGGITSGEAASSTSAMIAGVYLCMALATVMFLRAPRRSVKVTTLVASAVALLAGSTLLIDPSGDVIAFTGRAALLVAFLLSPALVARHA